MNDLQSKLDYSDAVANWFIEQAESHFEGHKLEESLQCLYIAATILTRQNRTLTSIRLESALRHLAELLPPYSNTITVNTIQNTESCLHVVNEVRPAGGITSMLTRWIPYDAENRIHNLAILNNESSVPEELNRVISNCNGEIFTSPQNCSDIIKATWLRTLAKNLSVQYVILHIGPTDVISGVAFGISDNPKVILVNNTAHTFWTCASIADLILNVRGSELEKLWTMKYRGAARCSALPIPVPMPKGLPYCDTSYMPEKQAAKKKLNLPENSIVLLTVGTHFKFMKTENLDFVKTCEHILKLYPNTYLLAVGFEADKRWHEASIRLLSRIRVLGALPQYKLAEVHKAADIYIEGFPFGTTTSLLEAGVKGIPVVLAPAECPPPYASDGIALDAVLERPVSIEDFKLKIAGLIKSHEERKQQGIKIRNSIIAHHTDSGWCSYLKSALANLPDKHQTNPSIKPTQTPTVIHEYWTKFMTTIEDGLEETLEHAVTRALLLGLKPRLTVKAKKSFSAFSAVRKKNTIPLPLLTWLCNNIIPIIPIKYGQFVFRLLSYVYRPKLISRLRTRLPAFMGGIERPREMYSEYRKI
jgi:glycosyltransferase involved in cell wall biosynthesis